MKRTFTEKQFSTLPKWAQRHIEVLETNVTLLGRELDEREDTVTPAPVYIDDCVPDPETGGTKLRRRNIQSYRVTVEGGGVNLDIISEDDGIRLVWRGRPGPCKTAMIPCSGNSIRLERLCRPEPEKHAGGRNAN
jgi:hypothetical protein